MKHVFKLFTFVLDTPGWTPFTLMNIFTPSCQHQRGAGSTRESEKMGEEGPDGKCDKVLNCLINVIRMIRIYNKILIVLAQECKEEQVIKKISGN